MDKEIDSAYRGRKWVASNPQNEPKIKELNVPKIRVISYTILSKSAATSIDYSIYTGPWETRSMLLLEEILSYDADIICLQNVDEFSTFWSPKLQFHGYDCIFQLKTQERDFYKEGILIAYRRVHFTLLKSVPIFFNEINTNQYMLAKYSNILCERCVTDDVGLVAFITPKDKNAYPSSFLVVTSSLYKEMNDDSSEIREVQSNFLMKRLEYENRDHHLPIILTLNLNDQPDSNSYHLIRTGRISMSSKPPKACCDLKASPSSRATALLSWLLPTNKDIADTPIERYEIQVRVAGGVTHIKDENVEHVNLNSLTDKISSVSSHLPLGFQPCLMINHGDTVRYKTIRDHQGRKKVIPDLRYYAYVKGLSADIPYEFRIRGINSSGLGEWSESSSPITLQNPENAPLELEPIYGLPNLQEVGEFSEYEKLDVLKTDNIIENLPYINSFSHTTPRLIDGTSSNITSRIRGLPIDCNPRDGWLKDLNGTTNEELTKELNREFIIGKSVLRHNKGEFIDKKMSEYDTNGLKSEVEKAQEEKIIPKLPSLALDARVLADKLGVVDKRDVHNLTLYSAYENYSSGGEPLYNSLFFHQTNESNCKSSCLNYIFYTAGPLYPVKLLNIPTLSQLYQSKSEGEESKITPSFTYLMKNKGKFSSFLDEVGKDYDLNATSYSNNEVNDLKLILKKKIDQCNNSNQIFHSKYSIINIEKNNLKQHYYLPNADFGSTHFAIGADFFIDVSKLATCYK